MSQDKDQKQWQFAKIDASGRTIYLHFIDLSTTTTNPQHAWQGTERQAHNVRAKHAHTRTLPLVRKQPKQNPR